MQNYTPFDRGILWRLNFSLSLSILPTFLGKAELCNNPRFQGDPAETLRWNREALRRAEAVGDERVAAFYPSLYLNMGRSYELLGEQVEAEKYYALAAALGIVHQGP